MRETSALFPVHKQQLSSARRAPTPSTYGCIVRRFTSPRQRIEAMAASTSPASLLLPSPSIRRVAGGRAAASCCLGGPDHGPAPAVLHAGRRQSLLLSLSAPFALGLAPARAEDIPLFGVRKKLKTIQEGAEKIVREGEKAVEQGIQAAEKEIGAAEEIVREGETAVERRIEAAEKEIGAAAAGAATGLELGIGGDVVQAGAVAAAEVAGVLAAVSIVNGILGSEGRSS